MHKISKPEFRVQHQAASIALRRHRAGCAIGASVKPYEKSTHGYPILWRKFLPSTNVCVQGVTGSPIALRKNYAIQEPLEEHSDGFSFWSRLAFNSSVADATKWG
jgi:hypothetical protein